MRRLPLIVTLVLVALPSLANTGAEKQIERSMESVSQAIAGLLPLVADSKKFDDEANREKILDYSRRLFETAHRLDGPLYKKRFEQVGKMSPEIAIHSENFEERTKAAYRALLGGSRQYARTEILRLTNTCIACHSSADASHEIDWHPAKKELKDMDPVSRASLFLSTGNLDEALSEYKEIASRPRGSGDELLKWERAVEQGIFLSIRIAKSPEGGLEIVEKALENDRLSEPFAMKLRIWRDDLREWKTDEKRRPASTGDLKTAELLVKQAERSTGASTVIDESRQIRFLRASVAFENVLRNAKTKEESASALLGLGICYRIVGFADLYPIHENYFESCIRLVPHSGTSKRCFAEYKESVVAGYTGSGGTSLPTDVKQRLDRLAQLSS